MAVSQLFMTVPLLKVCMLNILRKRPFNPAFLQLNVSYSRTCALSYGENRFLIFLLEEKIWCFENVYIYVTYHGNPQLLMDFLVNVL